MGFGWGPACHGVTVGLTLTWPGRTEACSLRSFGGWPERCVGIAWSRRPRGLLRGRHLQAPRSIYLSGQSRRLGHGRVRPSHHEFDRSPAGIRAGHAQDESSYRWCGRWSTWSLVRVGPAATDELGVPAQQRSGDTSRIRRKGQAAACSARSARRGRASSVGVGRALVKRNTATSCRSARISTSLAASERARSTSQLSTRPNIR